MNSKADGAGSNDPEMTELEDEFGPIMGMLRDGPFEVEPVEPGADLWSKIQTDIRGQADLDVDLTHQAAPEHQQPVAPVVSLDGARERRWGKPAAILTAVAAALLLIAVPVGLSLRSDGGGDVLLAAGELDVLDEASSESAVVELYDTEGNLWLDLDTSRSAGDGEFLELWLIEPDEDGLPADLISLGQIDGSGAYDIPDDVDLERFSVVDISVEPDDGDPQHSGDSIHRGIPAST